MKKFKTIILGCGASGAMCGIVAKEKSLAIVDVLSKPSKKILATGNGRCNLTNVNMSSEFFNVDIDSFLKRFDQKQTLDFFAGLGLETFADSEGRVYPLSNSAKSVVDVLNMKLERKAQIFLSQKINKVEKTKQGFLIECSDEVFECEKLVVATGGNTTEILSALGLSTKIFVPSLVALKCGDTRDLNGVKISNVLVKATTKSGNTKSEIGEVLFKENGISGIVVFNLSALFARETCFEGKIEIDLLPEKTLKEVEAVIENRSKANLQLDKMFVGMFLNAVANEVFKQTKINTNKNSSTLSKEQIKLLASAIKNLKFDVVGCYDNNQIFAGGIPLESLTENLMHKKIENLYFCGEIVDVDGICGGYNLQWAWTSGHIVGECL